MRIAAFVLGLLLPAHTAAASLADYFPCGGFFFGCDFVGEGPRGSAIQFASMIVGRVALFIGMVSTIAIIYGAIRMATSRGQSDGIEAGKKAIMWAVAGYVLTSLGFAFVEFVALFIARI